MVGPSYQDTKAVNGGGGIPSIGEHDATLRQMRFEFSKSNNNPQLVPEFVIDNGQDVGKVLKWGEYYVMGNEIGEGKLRAFTDNARSQVNREGFKWQGAPTWEEFAEQFNTTPMLRVRLVIAHDLEIKTDRGYTKKNAQGKWLTRAEFDAHDGEKSVKPKIRGYKIVLAKATIEVAREVAQVAQPTPQVSATVQPGQMVQTPVTIDPADDLPF